MVLRAVTIFILCIVLLIRLGSIRNEFGLAPIQYELFFSVSLLFPAIWLLQNAKWDNLILLYLGGVIGSIGVNISTNNGITFYIFPYVVSAISTILYIGKTVVSVKRKKDYLVYGWIEKTIYILISFSVVFAFFAAVTYVYRDGTLRALTSKIEAGPAAGIYTTADRAIQYDNTIRAINEYMPKDGNVIYIKLLPFGYLCSDARSASPRLWRTNLDYPFFEEYYQNNSNKLPDAIYIANEQYGITNTGITIGDYMQRYIDSTPHEIIELECGTIYIFEREGK